MFYINLEGLPVGKEPMIFYTAVFKIGNEEFAMSKIEKLNDVDLVRKLDRIRDVFFKIGGNF